MLYIDALNLKASWFLFEYLSGLCCSGINICALVFERIYPSAKLVESDVQLPNAGITKVSAFFLSSLDVGWAAEYVLGSGQGRIRAWRICHRLPERVSWC